MTGTEAAEKETNRDKRMAETNRLDVGAMMTHSEFGQRVEGCTKKKGNEKMDRRTDTCSHTYAYERYMFW